MAGACPISTRGDGIAHYTLWHISNSVGSIRPISILPGRRCWMEYTQGSTTCNRYSIWLVYSAGTSAWPRLLHRLLAVALLVHPNQLCRPIQWLGLHSWRVVPKHRWQRCNHPGFICHHTLEGSTTCLRTHRVQAGQGSSQTCHGTRMGQGLVKRYLAPQLYTLC